MSSAANLTREIAQHRSRTVELVDHAIHLDLSEARDAATFPSTSTLTLVCTESSVEVDLVVDEPPHVEIDGVDAGAPGGPFTVTYADSRVRIEGLTPGVRHHVVVHAQCAYSHTGEGLHRYRDPEDGQTYLYTHFEPTDARRVFACFDQPDLKARFRVSVTAPSGWLVRSNAVAQDETRPRSAQAPHVPCAVVTTTFRPTQPQSSYVVCIVAGPYHLVEDEWTSSDGRTIPLALLCRPAMAENLPVADMLGWTKAGLPWCESRFAHPYPWGKYDQIVLPEYNIGAMENPGLVTFNERYLTRGEPTRAEREALATTVLHEMAHMWFGNLVTMPWWDDLWLKESFADFIGTEAAAEVTEFEDAWVSFGLGRRAWAYAADQLPTTHPIVADIPDVEAARANFDGITYAKGASVLRQLVAYVGPDAFYTGVGAYFRAHAFGNATLEDFLVELSRASGRDMSAWSRAWLQTAGPDTLWVEDGTLHRESLDLAAGGAPVGRPHRLQVATFAVGEQGWAPLDADWLDVADDRTPLPHPGAVTLVDAGAWTYAKVTPDAATRTAMELHLAGLEPAGARALAWGQLWQGCRDAQLPAQAFLRTVLTQLPAETSPAVIDGVARQYVSAIAAYLPPSVRDAWGDALWRLAVDAARAPGDGALRDARGRPTQLFERALAWRKVASWSAPFAPASDPVLHRMLAGDGGPFHPDQDERWAMLLALSCRAATDDDADRLDDLRKREITRDATSRGAARALAVRAAAPQEQAKLAAWAASADTTLTNEQVAALVTGLAHPASVRVAQEVGLGERYLAQLLPWWAERSQVIASRLARGLFALVDDRREADAWLRRHPDAPGALRRIVVEESDGLRRAGRARQAEDSSLP